MSDIQRFAIYHLPEDGPLADFGSRWLGWSVAQGRPTAQFDVPGIADLTRTPRRYGFHATLKPPFRLAHGMDADSLTVAVAALAARQAPVSVDGLTVAPLGRFLALVPLGDCAELDALAFACVQFLDYFRRPASPAESAQRRARGLSARQEAQLMRWGYPFVGPEFRFHMTLTGPLDPNGLTHAEQALRAYLPPLPRPHPITSIALVGEGADGHFRLIERFALGGRADRS